MNESVKEKCGKIKYRIKIEIASRQKAKERLSIRGKGRAGDGIYKMVRV